MTDEEDRSRATPSGIGGMSAETLQLLPKLLWFLFAVVVFWLSYRPLLDRVQKGGVAKLAFATFQIEFAQDEFTKAVNQTGQQGQSPPQEFKFFADRIQREAAQLTGARALWISDNNPVLYFPERRALSALGISFDVAKNTTEAQQLFDAADKMNSPYDFIISDIVRDRKIDPIVAPCFPFPQSPQQAGCKSLQAVLARYPESAPPFIFYSQDGDRVGTPAGAFGATDRLDRLISLVLDAVERRQPREGQPFAK